MYSIRLQIGWAVKRRQQSTLHGFLFLYAVYSKYIDERGITSKYSNKHSAALVCLALIRPKAAIFLALCSLTCVNPAIM